MPHRVHVLAPVALLVLALAGAAGAGHREYDRHEYHDHYDGPSRFARPGLYLGASLLGGAYPKLAEELEDELLLFDVEVDPAVGFDVYTGLRLHPRFALETEFEMFPETEIEDDVGEFAELRSWSLTANGKFFILTGRVQPWALLGVGGMYAELEDTLGLGVREDDLELAVRFGSGLDVYLTETLALTAGANYLRPTGDLEGLDVLSFGGGVKIHFPTR